MGETVADLKKRWMRDPEFRAACGKIDLQNAIQKCLDHGLSISIPEGVVIELVAIPNPNNIKLRTKREQICLT